MEANSQMQPINSEKIKLKRFNLAEKIAEIEADSFREPFGSVEVDFDWQFYLEYYEDLFNLSSYEEAYQHWNSCGSLEERFANETDLEKYFNLRQSELPEGFDYNQYLALNPSLKAKCDERRYSQYWAIEHYLEHGRYEGRLYCAKTQNPIDQYADRAIIPGSQETVANHQKNRDQSGSYTSQEHTRLIAFYLPQFHPIPENDLWWGKGFTEWTNVSKAQPLFTGHYQPQLPADLGFYDLRVSEVREEQANLARQYGIHGFCYYYYWFAGKKLLHRPLDDLLASGKPDFPFCICWANENWTRRWDGSEHEILIAQDYSEAQNRAFAEDLVPVLKDKRYIRIDGRPLIVIYRADIIPDVKAASQQWRDIFRAEGVGEVHLCIMLTTFSGLRSGLADLSSLGFDSAVQFPPHETTGAVVPPPAPAPDFTGQFFDYREVAINAVAQRLPDFKTFPGVMPSFDNTSRRKQAAHAFLNSTPETYEFWLRGAIEKAKHSLDNQEQFVFINAWNEWAEGAHLEPDQKYGHAYLQATHRALQGLQSWRTTLDLLRYLSIEDSQQFYELIEQLEQRIAAIERSGYSTVKAIDRILECRQMQVISLLSNQALDIQCGIDSPQMDASVNTKAIKVDGWVISKTVAAVAIEVKQHQSVLKKILIDMPRPDVAQAYGMPHSIFGFCGVIEILDVAPRVDLHLDLVFEDGSTDLMQVISLQLQSEATAYLDQLAEKRQQLHRALSDSLQEQMDKLKAFSGARNNEFQMIISTLEKKIDATEWHLKAACDLLKQNQIANFFGNF